MRTPYPVLLLLACFVPLAASNQSTYGVVFQVSNSASYTPGGNRFNNEIGIDFAQKTLFSATSFIWRTLSKYSPTDSKNVQQVTLLVESISGVAFTAGDQIHLSASYVQGYGGNLKREVTGVLYHEMTHVWQWNGNGQAPAGLIEGIADYVRLKAGYAPNHWVEAGQGYRWDQGYDVTAHFLDYCNSLRYGFVSKLNEKMRSGYSVTYFSDLLGKSVDQLWTDYKDEFNQ